MAVRALCFLFFLCLSTSFSCKKSEPPVVAPLTPDADAPLVVPEPPKPVPVVVTAADIAPFIAHFPAVNEITERYNREMDNDRKNPGQLMSEGQREIARYLSDRGLEHRPFMRKAGKIIRGWLGIKLLNDPEVAEKGAAKSYLRQLSAEEQTIIKERYEELSAVLKDIPVE